MAKSVMLNTSNPCIAMKTINTSFNDQSRLDSAPRNGPVGTIAAESRPLLAAGLAAFVVVPARTFSISFLLLALSILLCSFPRPHFATVLHKLVDVKGNGALREVRIMYDLYHGNDHESSKPSTSQPPSSPLTSADKSASTYRAVEVTMPHSPKWYPTGIIYPWSHAQVIAHGPSEAEIASSSQHHPQYYVENNILRPYQHHANRITIKNVASHKLVRGKPLFVEVDFVPRFIPQMTYYVAVSVALPAHIRGRPWILGWHREVFPIPTCRLCTNREQSFTLPVTLFLPDDGWCPEGRVPSIWKIEAIPRESNARVMDQTDMILAYGYDDLRQLHLSNDPNMTVHCRGINEAIVA